eukprot:g2237.t1
MMARHAELQSQNRSMVRPLAHIRLKTAREKEATTASPKMNKQLGDGVVRLRGEPWLPSTETMPDAVPIDENRLPLVFESLPGEHPQTAEEVASEVRHVVRERLHVAGAALFRNVFKNVENSSVKGLHDITKLLDLEPMNCYAGGAALREEVQDQGKIKRKGEEKSPSAATTTSTTSSIATTAPAAAPPAVFTASDELPCVILEPHQEASYLPSAFPGKFFLFCAQPAAEGGESCVGDMRAVTRELWARHRDLAERLAAHGVRYTFRMGGDDSAYYNWRKQLNNGLELQWSSGVKETTEKDALEFSYKLPAFVTHQVTGERLFFNQAAVLHHSYFAYHPDWKKVENGPGGVGPVKYLRLSSLPEGAGTLPGFDACFGDAAHTAFTDAEISCLRGLVWKHTVAVQMQQNDLLALDNLLFAHGRFGWDGDKYSRKLQVSMAEPRGWDLGAGTSSTASLNSTASPAAPTGRGAHDESDFPVLAEKEERKRLEGLGFGVFPAPRNEQSGADLMIQLSDYNGLLLFRGAGDATRKALVSALGGETNSRNKNNQHVAALWATGANPAAVRVKSLREATEDELVASDRSKIDAKLFLHPVYGQINHLSANPHDLRQSGNHPVGAVIDPTSTITTSSSSSSDHKAGATFALRPNDVLLVDRLLADIPELPDSVEFITPFAGGGASELQDWTGSRMSLFQKQHAQTEAKIAAHCSAPANYVHDSFSTLTPLEKDIELRKDLVKAHRLLAHFGLDELIWNHVTARSHARKHRFFITSGERIFSEVLDGDSTNDTGGVIHGAIYRARPDVKAIVHAHSPAVVARGGGLLNRIVYYDWQGISDSADECASLMECATLAGFQANTIMLRHHGALVLGGNVREAFVNYFYLERVCETFLKTAGLGLAGAGGEEGGVGGSLGKVAMPDEKVARESAKFFDWPQYKPGNREWAALSELIEKRGL